MKALFTKALSIVAALSIIGCTGSTEQSRDVSKQEVEEGKQRRLKAIDEMQGVTPEMKERMKQQITGGQPADANARANETK